MMLTKSCSVSKPSRPNDKDLPLVAGYVEAHTGHPREAEANFTKSLAIDPNDATAYMNRGFVRNDLRESSKAAQDFEMALKLRPNYGEAHLGLSVLRTCNCIARNRRCVRLIWPPPACPIRLQFTWRAPKPIASR